ncbi:hypothetical protein PABG_05544 [Paracoccidioides brasiliensis Pb03]|nr:hypothetical protein PABG_05544 [Paracoccidioides brasiliensis Pb03]
MAATQFYSNISLDTEDDDEILEKAKVFYPVWMLSKVFETDISAIQLDNQLREFQVEIDRQWTPYMFPGALGCTKLGTTTKLGCIYETNGAFKG